jgi:transposase
MIYPQSFMGSPVMPVSSEIRVSVDVGYAQHSVAIGLSGGERLEEFEIRHRPEGFAEFFSRIETIRLRHGGSVWVAMEGFNGFARPLDRLVQDRGYRLLNINNLKLARFKEIFPAAAKTDRIDARKGLELMQLGEVLPVARKALQQVQVAPRVNDQLKRLTRRRQVLVDERTRILSRMQTDLQAVCPGLLEITGRAGNRWFLNCLTRVDHLEKLARLRHSTLLKIPAVGRHYASKIRGWQRDAMFSSDVDWVGPMILEDAYRILELGEAIKALDAHCRALLSESDIAQRVGSVPGFALICSSILAGEIGTLDRFARESSLAVYLGMANLDNSSGDRKGSKCTRHVNRRAKMAMMTGVDKHRKQVLESQRYYEKKRLEGKSHNQAIRALGRHLCRIIFNMIRDNRDYQVKTS